MRRRTPEQVVALEPESLSDWQLFRMSLVCGRINAVLPPVDAVRIQRLLIWFENLGSKDASGFERAILVFIVCIAGMSLGVLISILEITGTPWWSRYFPIGIFVVTGLVFAYIGKMTVLRAGGDVLVVEGYKRRITDKAARRAVERRKHYRPISARELDV